MKNAAVMVPTFILNSAGRDAEEQTSKCDLHGDFLSRSTPGGRSRCPDCMKIYLKEESLRKAEEKRTEAAEQGRRSLEVALLSSTGRAGIPKRYLEKDFDAYIAPTDEQVTAVKSARDYANNFKTNLARGSCLIMTGNTGTGKTHLACAIGTAVMKNGYSSLFIPASDLFLSITGRDQGASEMSMIRRFAGLDLLIVDEFAGGMPQRESATFFSVLNARYADRKPIILLTNLSLEELPSSAGLGERLFDRMKEGGGGFIEFGWDSFRGDKP